MTSPAVRVQGVSFSYPDGRAALSEVSLEVAHGERVALLGANGAGKTTLALHLNGLLTPDAGTVAIDGVVVGEDTMAQIRPRVGLVFQDPDDQLFMPTVGQDVAFGPANQGLPQGEVDQRVHEALVQVDMLDAVDRAPHHLSLGQRRRVAVATVLAMHPDVLVLDEPSSNLDPVARRELAEILQSQACAIIMVTHDLPYARQLCPRSVAMSAGRVVADSATAELLRNNDVMKACRLELPFGFSLPAPGSTVGGAPAL